MLTARTFAMSCLMTLIAATALAQAPARPPQTWPAYLQGQYGVLKANLIGSAEKMPEEHFSFRPAAGVRTFAEILAHTIETQYYYCSAAKGTQPPASGTDLEKKPLDKRAVVQMVKDGFAYCDDSYAKLTNEAALELIAVGAAPNQRQVARGNQLTMLIVHGNEHYGNLVTYMRIKGITPPSSAQ